VRSHKKRDREKSSIKRKQKGTWEERKRSEYGEIEKRGCKSK